MRRFTGLLLLPMALFLLVTPTHATTPTKVTGTITQIGQSSMTDVRMVGGILFYTFSASDAFAGGIKGHLSLSLKVVQDPTSATANGGGTLTGTVSGSQSGTATIHLILKATVVSGIVTSVQGELIIGQGTGGLTGFHAQGSLQAVINQPATYSELVHFDPA